MTGSPYLDRMVWHVGWMLTGCWTQCSGQWSSQQPASHRVLLLEQQVRYNRVTTGRVRQYNTGGGGESGSGLRWILVPKRCPNLIP